MNDKNYDRAVGRADRSMTMTTDELERLRLAAEDAAAGPWLPVGGDDE